MNGNKAAASFLELGGAKHPQTPRGDLLPVVSLTPY